MDDTLRERVDALERAVTDGDCDLGALTDDTEAIQRLDDLESRLDDVDDRVAELEAATQALRGYVGNVRSVNRDVEQRADAALAKAQAVEAALEEKPPTSERRAPEEPASPEPATSADGGLETDGQQPSERCHACGRPHDGTTETVAGATPPEQTDDGWTERDGAFESSTTGDDEPIPEQAEETGTLQRVREML